MKKTLRIKRTEEENKYGDPIFLLQFFTVLYMAVNGAKFAKKLDKKSFSRELTSACSNNSLAFRQRLEQELTFDNYKEKFDMLLHIEEIQKQKDIRNYDMKGKEFEQDSEDRRFLILTVSENSRKVGQFCKLNEHKTRIQSAMII